MKINLRPLICLLFFLPWTVSIAQTIQNAQNNQNQQNPPRQRQRQARSPVQTQVQNPNANLFPAHDPVMIKQDSVYYLFTTGGGVASSTDMIYWKREKPVFEKAPEWITQEMIPGFRGGELITVAEGLTVIIKFLWVAPGQLRDRMLIKRVNY